MPSLRPYATRARALGAAILLAATIAGRGTAAAEEGEPGAILAQTAVPAAPLAPRVLHIPTGWLQEPGRVYGSSGLKHRGEIFFAVSGGVGELAEIDINISDRFLTCTADCDGDGRTASDAQVVSALFKVGADADALFRGQPALAIGFRKSIEVTPEPTATSAKPKLAELYLAGSRHLGPVGLHAGFQLFDASYDSHRLLDVRSPIQQIRPFAGLEWVPSIYPRTTVLLDFSWVPELRRPGDEGDVALRWLAGWGIRYQALSWGSIELAVRHRQNEGLEDSTVFVRINGTVNLKEQLRGIRGRHR